MKKGGLCVTRTLRPILSLAATALISAAMGQSVAAQDNPSLNFYGTTGLIDMPSGEAQADGILSLGSAYFGPIRRNTLSFQITPRLSGSFRYLGVRKWTEKCTAENNCKTSGVDDYPTYYDRAFDLRYLLLKEGRYRPTVTVGFQDFIGTGLQSAEYIVATKHISPDIKVTAGLGWGRLGSNNPIGSPFGERPPIDDGDSLFVNTAQWFKGDVAAFGGIEWQINDKWGVKAEYSSDAYVEEVENRETFEINSPFNFGVEYQHNASTRFGLYYLYGSQVGFSAQLAVNPRLRPMGGVMGPGPNPVKPRPSRAADPEAWATDWVTQPDAKQILITNMNSRLERDGLAVEAMAFTATKVQVRLRNTRFDAESQAIGRVARTLSDVMPATVEVFEIIPVVNGVPTSMVTLRRADLESLEFSTDAAAAMRAQVRITDAGRPLDGLVFATDLYPQFNWSLTPYLRLRLFDLDSPLKADVGLTLSASYQIRPGLILSGAVNKKLTGNLDQPPPDIATVLPPVRSHGDVYDALGDPALEKLTLAYYSHLAPNIYGRVTVGYLERMFGGISTEVLWKPVDSRIAVGAELNYVAQRNPDQGFGFDVYDYEVATGHVSGYFDLGKGYLAQVDVGRYLAGDVGATFSLDREFENGWKVGAFATFTDVDPEDFGAGSFDKGIRFEVPLNWLTGQASRQTKGLTLRPFGGDGGARLDVDGRLFETVRGYHQSGIDAQWGRFWK